MQRKHWFIFILLGLIWGSSFMWIKIAVQEIGPTTLVAFRLLFGVLFGAAVMTIKRVPWPRTIKAWVPLIVIGITNLAVPFFLISWGEQTIDSAVAAILDATVPLFTIFLAHFLLPDDKMTPTKVFGLLVGFAGVVILMSKSIEGSQNSLLGQAAVVLASAFYAGSSIYVRKKTQEIPDMVRGVGSLVPATVVMWLAVLFTESPVTVPQLGITWVALLFLGVLGSGLAFILLFYLIHEIGPTRTTMVTYLFPLGGVTLGVVFLNEQLTWQLVAGAACIIASLVISNLQLPHAAPVAEAEAEG